jgi:hypothetical protein
MADRVVAASRSQRRLRGVLVVGYIALIVLGLTTRVQPRIFWTMLLPLLPISIVLMGYYNWRRVCPLAFFGELGRKLNRGTQRRVPKWLDRWFFLVIFSALLSMLVLRLVATNGDGLWLAGLLTGLALLALATNWFFTGKTWCNIFCPVGLIERIYTEPRSLPTTRNSQCTRCTACKSSCPDIDAENAYWRDLTVTGRRIATYSFPGLVLAFYTYFWLRYGDWEAYFDGRWTRIPVSGDLVLGPGFFFAPHVPALAAAILTLVVFSCISYVLFSLIEKGAARFVANDEKRRHLMLGGAAFVAFSIFYLFAGAPTLRRITGGTRVMAFAAPLLATLFLVKRSRRTREDFIREKGAAKLLRNWPFDGTPPDDPREVYGWIQADQHAREKNVAAYASCVREILADGLVLKEELALLEGIRTQLRISEREHEKVLEQLSEEERYLFEPGEHGGIEERAQLEGYQTALAQALLRRASEPEIAELRRAFGVTQEAHDRVLERIRGESGVLIERAGRHVAQVRGIHRELEVLGAVEPSDPERLLIYLLLREQDYAIDRTLDLLSIVRPSERIQSIRPRLLGDDANARRAAVRQLAEICPSAESLLGELEPWIQASLPTASERSSAEWKRVLESRATSSDPFIRAAAVWVAGEREDDWARVLVAAAERDPHPLVSETARHIAAEREAASTGATRFSELTTVERMQLLRGVSLFVDLDPEDLYDLARFGEEVTIAPPDVVCEEDDVEADDLFILLEGRVSVVVRGREGDRSVEREVAVLGAGDVIGEMSILDGSPRSATVRPKDGPIRVLRIPGQRFRSRLLSRSRVTEPLLITLAQRIRTMSRRVADG